MLRPLSGRFIKLLSLCAVASVLVLSCGGSNKQVEALNAQCDSLRRSAEMSKSEIEDLSRFFNDVSACIDSIAEEEKILYITIDPETGRSVTRGEMRSRLAQFRDLLARQRRRIAELSAMIGGKNNVADVSKLNSIIEYLNSQLDAKDARITHLQAELDRSNRQIDKLAASVGELEDNVALLESKNETLVEAVAVQDEIINECYVKVGTKKQLEAAGLLSGGFLRKTKLNTDAIDTSKMSAVDIRTFTRIDLDSKKPKILTAVPAGSYTLERVGDGRSRLTVTDPAAFWSLSNVLIIQL